MFEAVGWSRWPSEKEVGVVVVACLVGASRHLRMVEGKCQVQGRLRESPLGQSYRLAHRILVL